MRRTAAIARSATSRLSVGKQRRAERVALAALRPASPRRRADRLVRRAVAAVRRMPVVTAAYRRRDSRAGRAAPATARRAVEVAAAADGMAPAARAATARRRSRIRRPPRLRRALAAVVRA